MNAKEAAAAFERHLRAVTGLYLVVEYPPYGCNVRMVTPDRAKADAYAQEIRETAWWEEYPEPDGDDALFHEPGRVEVQKIHPGDKIDIGYNE